MVTITYQRVNIGGLLNRRYAAAWFVYADRDAHARRRPFGRSKTLRGAMQIADRAVEAIAADGQFMAEQAEVRAMGSDYGV